MVERRLVTGGEVRETDFRSKSPFDDTHEAEDALVLDIRTGQPRIELTTGQLSNNGPLLSAPTWKLLVRRLLDLIGAILALVLLSPVFLIVAVAIKATSPGPILFKQERVGKDGALFTLYKFRSMCVEAEEERDQLAEQNEASGPVFKIREDPRMTPIGALLRRSSIDELPQLWNVIRGDMCLVGPRPPVSDEVDQYSEWEAQRLRVKPGITCIWQVSGRSELDFETWVRMDLAYIENWSLWLDIKLLAKTIPAVLTGRGAY